MKDAKPRSCLAVLFARAHTEAPDREPLTRCAVCGKTGRMTTCEPLLVGGEVIGSVLVEHDAAMREQETAALRESVSQAAPVLANLRNLALAEFRAATDGLTGLPNKRAVHDVVKRMSAHASRTLTPLSAIVLDLDHFKQINDTFGHASGDDVLAAVGAVLASTVRASDFVGRNGGEEFIVLLPDTDAENAVVVAEKIRVVRIGEIAILESSGRSPPASGLPRSPSTPATATTTSAAPTARCTAPRPTDATAPRSPSPTPARSLTTSSTTVRRAATQWEPGTGREKRRWPRRSGVRVRGRHCGDRRGLATASIDAAASPGSDGRG